jgi:hypothetical protein
VFARLTNAYCLVCVGGSESFYSVFEATLADHIPVVHCTVAGCRFVGRVTVGACLPRFGRRAPTLVRLASMRAVAGERAGLVPRLLHLYSCPCYALRAERGRPRRCTVVSSCGEYFVPCAAAPMRTHTVAASGVALLSRALAPSVTHIMLLGVLAVTPGDGALGERLTGRARVS